MWRYSFSQVEIAINTPVYKINNLYVSCYRHEIEIHLESLHIILSRRFKVVFILFQGYNMNEHGFGQAENFITLPKISQVF